MGGVIGAQEETGAVVVEDDAVKRQGSLSAFGDEASGRRRM
jgi:hypothetical protein